MPFFPERVAVDPAAPGTILRIALGFEAVLTVGVGLYFTIFPRHYLLNTLMADPLQATGAALQLTQQLGMANALGGMAVGAFIPNTRATIESRRGLYILLLGFECLYVPLLLWQAYGQKGGLPTEGLVSSASQFVPFIAWRTFVLLWKGEWFGRVLDGGKTK
ncbi:hypothetical protein IFR05_014752 [Cadophora sp. M221]|nr:hypothetical protein IFR05_014752 [Cadophora sp. M221]